MLAMGGDSEVPLVVLKGQRALHSLRL